jgi:hypothetical protein
VFIQVQASVRITTLRSVCVGGIMIHWVETPLPSFYRLEGGG